jgi:hypothetical protein
MLVQFVKMSLQLTAISVLALYAPLTSAHASTLPDPTVQQAPLPPQPQGQILQTSEIDVTGNGKLDRVSLVGVRTDTTSPYFPKILLVVASPDKGEITIPLEGGYEPKMQFHDFNGDKLPEIFISSATGGSGGIYNYNIYSVKNNTPIAIPVPDPLHVSATFKKNYVVRLKLEETGKTYRSSIKDRKADYDRAGVYKNGKLLKQIPIMVDPYSLLQPVDIDKDGIYELQGIQRVSGIAHVDVLANVGSIWKWKNNKWMLIDSAIQPIK